MREKESATSYIVTFRFGFANCYSTRTEGVFLFFFVFFGLNIKGREIHKDATVWQTGRQERAYEVVLAMLSMYMRTSL